MMHELQANDEDTDTTTLQASAETTSAEDESKDEGVEDLDQPD